MHVTSEPWPLCVCSWQTTRLPATLAWCNGPWREERASWSSLHGITSPWCHLVQGKQPHPAQQHVQGRFTPELSFGDWIDIALNVWIAFMVCINHFGACFGKVCLVVWVVKNSVNGGENGLCMHLNIILNYEKKKKMWGWKDKEDGWVG